MKNVFKGPQSVFQSISLCPIYRENINPCKPEPEIAKPLPDNIWHLLFKCNLTDKLSFNGFFTAQTIQASTHNFCSLTITLYLSPKWFRHWQNTLLRLNAHSSLQIDCCIAVNHRQPFCVDSLNSSLRTQPNDHKYTKSEPSNCGKTFPAIYETGTVLIQKETWYKCEAI